jgi:multiple sugar transport system substrate-binding protein
MISRRQLLTSVSAGGLLGACRRDGGGRLAPAEGKTSAERAVNSARRFAGSTLTVGWESGMQAHDLMHFSGPLWEKLTGIRINVVELGSPIDAYRRVFEEHKAGTGALDCGMLAPAWMPDLLLVGALEPLDRYVAHYMVASDFDDLLPLYRDLGTWQGKRYGLFDDGDVLLLYYRRDLFEDPELQRELAARFGHPLGNPRDYDWQRFSDAARFFTEKMAPQVYGMAPFNRDLRWGWFQGLLRKNGGQFFDPATMKPGVDAEPGLRTMSQLAELDRYMPPGVADIAPKEAMLTTYASGNSAMGSFWPPLGRWTEGYGVTPEELGAMPRTRVAGKTGYALLPGGVAELVLGFLLCVFERSRRKEPAYLFLQWLNSPEISLERVMLPYALRDPFRRSHIQSPKYRSRWAAAPEYLDTLGAAATEGALLDLILPGHADYADAFFIAVTDVRLGTAVPVAMKRMAERWEAVTERYGRSSQQAAYAEYLRKPGAMYVRKTSQ